MPTIDAQVHAYERNHPGRPWAAVLHGPAEVTGDDMVAAMDAVGVDGALLISPFTMYRYDADYATEVHARHPGRFGLIKPVDSADPGVAETVADWAATPGRVGIRIMMNRGVSERSRRCRHQPGAGRRGAARAAGEHPVLGPSGAGAGAGSPQSRYGDRDRPSRLATAVRATTARGALRRFAGCPEARRPPERRHQDHRRLHALARGLSVQRYLGPARAYLRCLRHRSLHVGHRLDPRGRAADLQAGRRCVPRRRSPLR